MTQTKLALIGNPNIGKSSLFNQLTGLRQHIGNYPGVTVDKKTGNFQHNNISYLLYDLPGTYSLYPNSQDEEVVDELLIDLHHKDHPDKVIVVADAANLKRSLQLLEQVLELNIPTLLVINMIDEAKKKGIETDVKMIADHYQIEVVVTNARTGFGISDLKDKLNRFSVSKEQVFIIPKEFEIQVQEVQQKLALSSAYCAWHLLAQADVGYLGEIKSTRLHQIKSSHKIISKRLQVQEFLARNKRILELLESAQTYAKVDDKTISTKIDKWVMHPLWGYVIFAVILFLVFQSIFTLSQWPMQWIETGFVELSSWIKTIMPNGPLKGLVADGIVPGIGGILIFVPQIAILFLGILILEETGYMSRVVFLMDRWMRPFGLNGKSVVPLISGAACAIPAVMSARNIEHKKEKLITILVTPFITCSARLPVYSLIIGLIIADGDFLFFNLKGLVLLGMYAIGLLGALLSGLLLRGIIKDKYKSYLAMEIPSYKKPLWKNVFVSLWGKVSAFVFGAGKIILAISIVLWVLASFGPDKYFNNASSIVANESQNRNISTIELDAKVKAYKLEHSYLGIMGNAFEPFIRPLGYDWKMGIGILSSFAAREVFVPTMATIYSIADVDDNHLLGEKMKAETNKINGKPLYNLASGISLLLFYAFAMMCMSTFAAVKRETKSWKWPIIQLFSMTGLAYLTALISYQILK